MSEQTTEREATAKRFALGERVQFSHVLARQNVEVPNAGYNAKYQQHWLTVEQSGNGFVIGYRTLSNGYTTYDRDEGNVWHPVGYVRCALVAVSLHRKPAVVPLDALSPLPAR